jgi:hypothetical protein
VLRPRVHALEASGRYGPDMAEDSDLTFNVPEELYAKLKAHAETLSMSPEECLREHLAKILSRPDED